MPRVPVTRSLPQPRRLFRGFAGFPPDRSHKDVLLEKIRAASVKLREEKSRAFYAMRELADFFGVSVGAISAVYKELEREGILNRVHGSRTILSGKKLDRGKPLRAVIGLPMAMRILATSRPERAIWLMLMEYLSTTGYAADLIVHDQREHFQPEFVDRVLRHGPDILLWCWPPASPGCRDNILSLRDHGIRCIAVQTAGLAMDIPCLSYLEEWRPAYDQLAARWQEAGIERVLIPVHAEFRVEPGFRKLLCASLTKAGLAIEQTPVPLETLAARCRKQKKLAVAFLNRHQTERAALARPSVMTDLMRVARVGLCRGSIRCSALHTDGARADVVDIDVDAIAIAILKVIPQLPSLGDGLRGTFLSEFQEQMRVEPFPEVEEMVLRKVPRVSRSKK